MSKPIALLDVLAILILIGVGLPFVLVLLYCAWPVVLLVTVLIAVGWAICHLIGNDSTPD